MRAAGLVALLCLTGGPVAANDLPGPAKPADQTVLAAARAEGDAIVSAAAAQDVFENVTGADGTSQIHLRHRQSGFDCVFWSGSRINNVVIYPGALPRGDDVGCNTSDGRVSRTVNFTRNADRDQDTFDNAVAALRRHMPRVEPIPAGTPPAGGDTPAPLMARFANSGPPATIEEVVSAHARGWLVEERVTGLDTPAYRNEDPSARVWVSTVAQGLRRTPQVVATSAPVSRTPKGPATAQEIALAREEGDRILRGHDAGGQFENVTHDRFASLRHRASGIVCGFDLNGSGSVIVGPGSTVTRRADAASCFTGVADFALTLTFFPNTDHLTVAQALKAAVGEYGTVESLSPFSGKVIGVKTDKLPEHLSAHFTSGGTDHQRYVYIGAAVAGDWVLIAEDHGPAGQTNIGDLVGEMSLVKAMMDVTSTGAPKPAR